MARDGRRHCPLSASVAFAWSGIATSVTAHRYELCDELRCEAVRAEMYASHIWALGLMHHPSRWDDIDGVASDGSRSAP
ncbi:hypothetical protein L226DRAFT_50621 [Lentinus tigrinus ALCF2SS1-7]|uniref:uncharacterized protein n=1 Tax=Lentinus tigrinus ALCF2SS1-7 TaxID=1328758 RepID=UPI001165E866|nr:hypothetical protein L226DRAFT_50621 [Lentinus tigrinus ALCF2SS1-7]